MDAVKKWHVKAEDKAVIDYGFRLMVSDLNEQTLAELPKVLEEEGIVYGETSPLYLLFDRTALEKPDFEGTKYVWSPPLRPKEHQEVLWNAIKAKQLQIIGSDQCSFNFNGKK